MNDDDLGPFNKPGPFDKDTLENRASGSTDDNENIPSNGLPEKDFIQESQKIPTIASIPLLIWLALLSIAIALIWGSMNWLEQGFLKQEMQAKPFLEVSNRDFSLFLWQFPEFMRANTKEKTGYLPGFQYVQAQTMVLAKTEDFVIGPPDVLFLYHTWDRLLSSDFIPRAIPAEEFREFLSRVQEWTPQYWKDAPIAYAKLIESNEYFKTENLQKLPESTLPLEVRRAFLGWKNYFKEGPLINQLAPTFGQVEKFLKEHPHYARNYWRNIQEIAGRQVAGKNYLLDFLKDDIEAEQEVPKDQLAPFLKVALFNADQAQKGL